jgi:hypothetical protein
MEIIWKEVVVTNLDNVLILFWGTEETREKLKAEWPMSWPLLEPII